jgi:hypothetical protein
MDVRNIPAELDARFAAWLFSAGAMTNIPDATMVAPTTIAGAALLRSQ